NVYDDLERQGAAVVAFRDGVDTSTAVGRFFRTILAGMAEFERELIAERLTAGRAARARQGKYVGGHVAYGYRVTPAGWTINEREASVVREIHARRLAGESYWAICRSLDERGVPTA